MNRVFIVVIGSILMFSCAIRVEERYFFTPSPYQEAKDITYVRNSEKYSDVEKEARIEIIKRVCEGSDSAILVSDSLNIARYFYQRNDSIKLEYFTFTPNDYHQVIHFYIGNGSRIFHFMEKLMQLSVATKSKIYVLNYRSYGKSEGVASFSTQFEDNMAFLKDKAKQDVGLPIISMGYSLGSVFGGYIANQYGTNQLVLLAPFSNPDDMAKHVKKSMTKGFKVVFRPFVYFKMDDDLKSISNTEQVEAFYGKLDIFHGIDDETLPFEMGQEMYDVAVSEQKLLFILEGGHTSPFVDSIWNKVIIEVIK